MKVAVQLSAHLEDCVIPILAKESVISSSMLEGVSQTHLSGLPQGCHFIIVHNLGEHNLPGCMVWLHHSTLD